MGLNSTVGKDMIHYAHSVLHTNCSSTHGEKTQMHSKCNDMKSAFLCQISTGGVPVYFFLIYISFNKLNSF